MVDKEKSEICYECRSHGDNYYLDGDNNWIYACDDCLVDDELGMEFK